MWAQGANVATASDCISDQKCPFRTSGEVQHSNVNMPDWHLSVLAFIASDAEWHGSHTELRSLLCFRIP